MVLSVWWCDFCRWTESMKNLFLCRNCCSWRFHAEIEFLWKRVGMTDSLGLVNQGGEHSLSVRKWWWEVTFRYSLYLNVLCYVYMLWMNVCTYVRTSEMLALTYETTRHQNTNMKDFYKFSFQWCLISVCHLVSVFETPQIICVHPVLQVMSSNEANKSVYQGNIQLM